ncbi:MAG: hypothetical protein WC052_02305 [Patescibacteria group bacterium]|jgi:hypothetical protein
MIPSIENPALNERWLRWATFWALHRDTLRQSIIGFVVIVEAAALLFSGYSVLDYFVLSRARDVAMERSLTRSVDVTQLHAVMAPKPLPAPVVVALAGSGNNGRFDVLLKFVNANPQWVAWVTYRVGEVSGTTQVLPDSERFAIAPAAASSPSGAIDLSITTIRWQRIRDVAAYKERVPEFVVRDVTYIPGSGGVSSGATPSRVQFIAKNDSAYGFWTVGFTVVLLQGDQAVAANMLRVEQVAPGAERTIAVNFYSAIVGVTKALVVPDVNVVDQTNIMDQPGELMRF